MSKLVNFYTHGTSVVGFGHMNRCVKLASEILSTNLKSKSILRVYSKTVPKTIFAHKLTRVLKKT